MDYKDKNIEKTLLRAGDKIDVSDTEMKTINVNGSRYYIQDKEDEITVVHQLISQGFTVSRIAQILNISERKVRNMINDCW